MLTQTQDYDMGDIIEMESMQFVNPREVNPLISPASTPLATGPLEQVSSKPLNMLLHNDDIQLKMEEFGDLSALLPAATPNANLIACIDELNTPIFDKDAFDFIGFNDDTNDLKVKVEYNAQLYQWSGTQQAPSNDNAKMFLYQPQNAQNSSFTGLRSFEADIGPQHASLDNISLNSNIKYNSSSNVPSPQDDQYSYLSSPADDQQLHSPFNGHYDSKPKLNLMIDQFRFPIKEEGPSTLNTPDVIDDVVNMGTDFNILDLVNNEDITILSADEDLIPALTSHADISSPSSTSSTIGSTTTIPAKRARKRKSFYDDDDEDYIPPTKRKSTVNFKDLDIDAVDNYSSDDSDYEVKKSVKKAKVGKPRGRPPKRTDSMSSDGSKDMELSKYRELRDKNNEASRKSRLKRKVKEQEYEKEADDLHVKNIKLKAQVEELEKLVSAFRNNLFKILVNK